MSVHDQHAAPDAPAPAVTAAGLVLDPAALRRAVRAATAGRSGPALTRARERALSDYVNGAAAHLPPVRWMRVHDAPPVLAARTDRYPEPADVAARWAAALRTAPPAADRLPGAISAQCWTPIGILRVWYLTDRNAYLTYWRHRRGER
ncbi:hypothetical protein [Nocardia asteroides]|uniref:hypothetical protein n=1 Tax=Nocardia asteroides TaxID=1824 RepID=UPI001E3A57ED|nr:hypothetical protein [Nocardia asteroides]UGT61730.1 hypothetical protein LTT61_32280 [Nocardia asteroides]